MPGFFTNTTGLKPRLTILVPLDSATQLMNGSTLEVDSKWFQHTALFEFRVTSKKGPLTKESVSSNLTYLLKSLLLNSGTGSLNSWLVYHTSMIEETDCTLSIISDTHQ